MTQIFNNSQPILEIDLNRIKENFHTAKSLLGPGVVCAAVTKANAYGLGALKVCNALFDAKCNEFYFIYTSEALEVAKFLPKCKIYVLCVDTEKEMELIVENALIPVLSSPWQISCYEKIAKNLGKKLPAVIHFDTGMARMGLESKQIESLDLSVFEVVYIMSHLACADEPDHPLNKKQLSLFIEYTAKFPNAKLSFANSAGIFLGEEYHFNQVRPGCMLYGIAPNRVIPTPVQQVVTLKARVVQVRTLEKNLNVSYGARHTAKAGDKIATIAIGYADGYFRSQTNNNAYCYYNGKRLPIVGTITMDFIMADVTSLTDSELSEMKYVELMGDNITVDEVAINSKTIGYEVLTSLGNRFNKVYK